MRKDEQGNKDEAVAGHEADTADYEVGFGKPPKANRFGKGKSGNPKGRPRGAKNFSTIVREELQQHVLIRKHGRQKSIPKVRAIAKQLTNQAAAGDHRAIKTLIDYDTSEQKRAGTPAADTDRLDEADQQIIAHLFDRVLRAKDDEGGEVDGKPDSDKSRV